MCYGVPGLGECGEGEGVLWCTWAGGVWGGGGCAMVYLGWGSVGRGRCAGVYLGWGSVGMGRVCWCVPGLGECGEGEVVLVCTWAGGVWGGGRCAGDVVGGEVLECEWGGLWDAVRGRGGGGGGEVVPGGVDGGGANIFTGAVLLVSKAKSDEDGDGILQKVGVHITENYVLIT